ncbi:WecB/TagA/CpsF family glycosyltransferase, partial [Anaerostipes sp.]|uniref:WecB/TagA/CpsF family glycosyltransferase n=1 Tax=Anaerostipes sp. TaxID=1872530 RepID=UPI002584350C
MGDEFIHKIDKSQIPVCKILGVDIADVNMEWVLDFTKKNIKALSGDYCCVSNVHTTVTAFKDEKYCSVQNGGIFALPDGGPLSSLGRKRGHAGMRRVTGPDFMKEIFLLSEKNGYRHFFYGSTQETLNKLKNNLLRDYP